MSSQLLHELVAQRERFDVIVIGGGIAGLVAAWECVRAGRRPILFEARGYVGGQIASLNIAGARVDIGAESFAPRGTAVSSMVDELGLKLAPPEGGRASLFLPPLTPSAGDPWALHPFIPGSVMGIPSRLHERELETILGDEGARAAREDTNMPAEIGQDCPDLAGFVQARMGPWVVNRLVRPIVAGIFSADPSRLDADRTIPHLKTLTRENGSLSGAVSQILARSKGPRGDIGISGGMGMLVDATRWAITRGGGKILTRVGAQTLTRSANGWSVEVANVRPAPHPGAEPVPEGEPVTFSASGLVLATSPASARRLLSPLVTEIQALDLPTGAPIVRSFLAVTTPGLDAAPVGPGLLVAPDSGCPVRAKALSQLDVKWPWVARSLEEKHAVGTHLLRLSHGRPGDEEREPTREELVEEATILTGVTISEDEVIDHRSIHWNGTLAQADPTQRRAIDQARAQAESLGNLAVTGAWVSGSGISAVVDDSRKRTRNLLEQL